MARAKIEDLPKDIKIRRKEMGNIVGGVAEIHVMLGPYPDAIRALQRGTGSWGALAGYTISGGPLTTR